MLEYIVLNLLSCTNIYIRFLYLFFIYYFTLRTLCHMLSEFSALRRGGGEMLLLLRMALVHHSTRVCL